MGTASDYENMRNVLQEAIGLFNTPALPDAAKRIADRLFLMVVEWLSVQIKEDRSARKDAWEIGDCNCGLSHFLKLNAVGDNDRLRVALLSVHGHNTNPLMFKFQNMPPDVELFFLRMMLSAAPPIPTPTT